MVTTKRIKYTALVMSVITLQLILPFVMSVGMLCIKEIQEYRIQHYAGNVSSLTRLDITGVEVVDGNEVKLAGRWYDIAATTHERGRLIAYVIDDDDETQLKDCPLSKGDKNGHDEHYRLAPFIFLYYEKPAIWEVPIIADVVFVFHDRYKNDLESRYPKVVVPPPQC